MTMKSANYTQTELTQSAEIDHEVGNPTGEYFDNLEELEDVGHPKVPKADVEYLRREIKDTGRTDVEIVTKILDENGHSPLLIGEPGVGKDQLIREIAAETNRPVVFVNFAEGTTYSELVGMFSPKSDGNQEIISKVHEYESEGFDRDQAIQLVSGAEDNFEWKDGLLTTAARKGWIFCADEINAAQSGSTMALHGVTQSGNSRHLTILKTGEELKPGRGIHPEFRFCATMNPTHHLGTNEMNEAFRSRFFPIPMDYLDPDAETKILVDNTPLDSTTGRNLVDFANNHIRNMAGTDGKISTSISTRELKKIGHLSDGGSFMDVKEATRVILSGHSSFGDEKAILKTLDSVRL